MNIYDIRNIQNSSNLTNPNVVAHSTTWPINNLKEKFDMHFWICRYWSSKTFLQMVVLKCYVDFFVDVLLYIQSLTQLSKLYFGKSQFFICLFQTFREWNTSSAHSNYKKYCNRYYVLKRCSIISYSDKNQKQYVPIQYEIFFDIH